jgi:hypothetical protein
MPELVVVPISFFELVGVYERPLLHLWMDRVNVVQDIFDALKPWDPAIDDVEVLSEGKPSEQGIRLKLPLKRVSFFFGPASFTFTRDGARWQAGAETIEILDAAVSALSRSSGVKIALQRTAYALHIQPRSLRFVDILRPFLAGQLRSLEDEQVTTMAAVAKWSNRKVTIDGSASIANGIFLKLERDFPSVATYHEMVQQLNRDEDRVFEILGVEEVQG